MELKSALDQSMALSTMPVTANNVRPTATGVDLGVDVDIQIGDTHGEVTLIKDHDGEWVSWGEPSNWASSDLHNDLDDVLAAARVAILASPPTLPMYAVDGIDGGGVANPAGGTWWPHEPIASGDVLEVYNSNPDAGEWSS